jgi:hypothetical protein
MAIGRRVVVFAWVLFVGASMLYSQSQATESSPADLLRTFKSLYVNSKTVYIKKGVTEGAILKELQKKQLDLDIAIKTDSSAETVLTIERQGVWPQWDYSYRLDHQSSGTVLAAGKVKAIDGGSAAKQIAEQIVKRIADVRGSTKKTQ